MTRWHCGTVWHELGRRSWGVMICVTLFPIGCGLNGGIAPLRSGIEGKITFVGLWPDSLFELRVVAFQTYDPQNFRITDLTAWSDPLPIRQSFAEYHFSLPPGEYELILLAGRFAGKGWTPLVKYIANQEPTPTRILLADRSSVVLGIDFVLKFTGTASGISGRIVFANPWPDTVTSIRVGALYGRLTDPKILPVTDLLTEINFRSRVFVKNDTSYEYSIELPPGTYRTVGVTWLSYHRDGSPESWENLGDLLVLLSGTRPVLGVYNRDGSLAPDSVVVEPNLWLTGLDIRVDFDRTRL